jgi:hypothetical protein
MPKMSKEQAAQARKDLRALHGDDGFSMVYSDGIFANSLVSKYGMSLGELEIASGYRKAKKASTPSAIRRRAANAGAKRERDAIVSFIRAEANFPSNVVLGDLMRIASKVAAGEHLK